MRSSMRAGLISLAFLSCAAAVIGTETTSLNRVVTVSEDRLLETRSQTHSGSRDHETGKALLQLSHRWDSGLPITDPDAETKVMWWDTKKVQVYKKRKKWNPCRTCRWAMNRVVEGKVLLLPHICNSLYLNHPNAYGVCMQVLQALVNNSNKVR